jgi:hypothetical protein
MTRPRTWCRTPAVLLGLALGAVLPAPSANAQSAPIVSVATVNPGLTVDRGQCVRLSLPGDASAECGDQRFGHALPSVRTMNRVRTPILTYNSAHANPRPLIAADVTLDAALGTPSRVDVAVVFASGQNWGVKAWSGWAGGTRRLVYDFDAASLQTGVYAYTLQVTAVYGGGSHTGQASGELVVVNRQSTPFGAGWWLAGLEQVYHLANNRKLWVGGDGSARVYTYANDTTWVGANLERPDTLKRRVNAQGVWRYARLLPDGGRIVFRNDAGSASAAGATAAATGRTMASTRWAGSSGRTCRWKAAVPTSTSG